MWGVPVLLGEAAGPDPSASLPVNPERRCAGCLRSNYVLPSSTLHSGIEPTWFTQWRLFLPLALEPGQGDGWVPASPSTLLGPRELHPHPPTPVHWWVGSQVMASAGSCS